MLSARQSPRQGASQVRSRRKYGGVETPDHDTFFLALVGEPWLVVLAALHPTAAAFLRAASRSARQCVSEAGLLLLRHRLSLVAAAPLRRFSHVQVLVTAWRSRPGASMADITHCAIFAAEHGLMEHLVSLAASPMSLEGTVSLGFLSDELSGVTPLHAAASAGQASICEFLLGESRRVGPSFVLVSLARMTAKGRNPVHSAAVSGDLPTMEVLLSAAKEASEAIAEASAEAAIRARRPVVEASAAAAASVQELLLVPDRKQRSAALLALLEGHVEVCLALLQALGPESFRRSPDNESSPGSAVASAASQLLVAACECNAAAVVAAVLASGADPNFLSPAGQLPICACAVHGAKDALEVLLQSASLDVDRLESTGRTALHLGCQLGHVRTVELLLTAGANPRLLAPGNRSALYIAAEHGSLSCVEVLLRVGGLAEADIYQPSTRLTTPLSAALRRGHAAVAELLNSFAQVAGGSAANELPKPIRRCSSAAACCARSTSEERRSSSESAQGRMATPRGEAATNRRPTSGMIRSLSLPRCAPGASPSPASENARPTARQASQSPRPQPQSTRPSPPLTPRTPPTAASGLLEQQWQQRQNWRLERHRRLQRMALSPRQASSSPTFARNSGSNEGGSASMEPQQQQRAAMVSTGARGPKTPRRPPLPSAAALGGA